MFKNLLIALLLLTLQLKAETVSQIVYIPAWTARGMEQGLNAELNLAQAKAYSEGKFFKFVELSITNELGNAFILYNTSDKMGEINPFFIQVAYVPEWFSGSGMAEKLQDKINSLQNSAKKENKLINIVSIKIGIFNDDAFIIYETSPMK